jgi:C4-dicarboxylate-specific signal transduction histidine kinase
VILQILNNAATALEGLPPGRERRLRIDAALIKDRVQVLISDTGPGFSNPDRVFDPFFTTKKPGEGPGLGLTLCYSIVREHGGEISAFNLHPHGAAVAIELPVIEAVDETAAAREVFTQ